MASSVARALLAGPRPAAPSSRPANRSARLSARAAARQGPPAAQPAGQEQPEGPCTSGEWTAGRAGWRRGAAAALSLRCAHPPARRPRNSHCACAILTTAAHALLDTAHRRGCQLSLSRGHTAQCRTPARLPPPPPPTWPPYLPRSVACRAMGPAGPAAAATTAATSGSGVGGSTSRGSRPGGGGAAAAGRRSTR